jgi:hypothetical protein
VQVKNFSFVDTLKKKMMKLLIILVLFGWRNTMAYRSSTSTLDNYDRMSPTHQKRGTQRYISVARFDRTDPIINWPESAIFQEERGIITERGASHPYCSKSYTSFHTHNCDIMKEKSFWGSNVLQLSYDYFSFFFGKVKFAVVNYVSSWMSWLSS